MERIADFVILFSLIVGIGAAIDHHLYATALCCFISIVIGVIVSGKDDD